MYNQLYVFIIVPDNETKTKDMKIQANEVKEGMEIAFGWSQWLKVNKIEIDFQKNGKELRRFYGTSKQEITGRAKRKYPTIENNSNDEICSKSLTKVEVR